MELRNYQKDAIKSVLKCLQTRQINPCVEIPTGGGKTPIIATIAGVIAKAGGRVLILAHRKELLQQTAEKLGTWAEGVKFSIVSAGLGERDYSGQIVIAGIQSVYKNAKELCNKKPINFIIVDEAHLIPDSEDSEGGMYQSLIRDLQEINPRLKVVGLTATPYRLKSGSVIGEKKILNEIVYKVGVPELIEKGFLAKLHSRLSAEVDLSNVRVEHGEFKTADLEDKFLDKHLISETVDNIVCMTRERKKVLIFCCSVAHCKAVTEALQRKQNQCVEMVTGDTPAEKRAEILRRFKGDIKQKNLLGTTEQDIKYLTNVEVLTTGFDATNIDCVCLLRPTMSPGLYYQMVGRGFRIHPGKEDCLILDFAGNIERHGAIDQIEAPFKKDGKGKAPTKKCPRCLSVIPAQSKTCPMCDAQILNDDFECPRCHEMNSYRANFCFNCGFQLREIAKHDSTAQVNFGILSTEIAPDIKEDIADISFTQHTSKRNGKNSLRVDYTTTLGNVLSEYVCFEHEGFARRKAEEWWAQRSKIPCPWSVPQAYYLAMGGYIAKPSKLIYKPKRPEDFAPQIKTTNAKPLAEPVAYPRVDNPLNISCQECGACTFTYVQPVGGEYEIRCAKCGSLYACINKESEGSIEALRNEIQAQREMGIEYYNPNAGLEDFYELESTGYNNEDEVPPEPNYDDDLPF